MQWVSQKFDGEIKINVPFNPKPIKLKKTDTFFKAYESNSKKKSGTEDNVSDILYLVKSSGNGDKWRAENIEIKYKKMDIVEFSTTDTLQKFIIIRTKNKLNEDEVSIIAETLYNLLQKRYVEVFVRQHKDNLNDMIVTVVPATRADKINATLNNHNFIMGDESAKIELFEGDLLKIRFRGNMIFRNSDQQYELIFNSQIDSTSRTIIDVKDKYLQKNFDDFRAILQIFLSQRQKMIKSSNKSTPFNKPLENNGLLAEFNIYLPKIVDFTSVTRKTSVNLIESADGVTDKQLKILAKLLGPEWRVLAENYLDVPVSGIDIILKNQPFITGKDNDQERDERNRYEVLLQWAKVQQRSFNKAAALQMALYLCGRPDLSDMMASLVSPKNRKI